MSTIGVWLENSGWESKLIQVDITSPRKVHSMLSASHIVRTRYVYQVTLCALYILKHETYEEYVSNFTENEGYSILTKYDWSNEHNKSKPHFFCWQTVLDLEFLQFEYMKSVRPGDFDLYLSSLRQLAPWFFILDHHNLSRWLPVHIRDMLLLKERHPREYAEFQKGHFVVHKTSRHFCNSP